ncbi:hypothetical protein FZEAL_2350 [Fusarium zealandicum]|uniref:Uncharacterized protein n=1 Tax=Fusarium zealandicum TaxID=1053134 RepID=A0A8H4URP1_9HYPO|nr:hypothetical protein FZEAL_2350 [Fusarium zealandicum]
MAPIHLGQDSSAAPTFGNRDTGHDDPLTTTTWGLLEFRSVVFMTVEGIGERVSLDTHPPRSSSECLAGDSRHDLWDTVPLTTVIRGKQLQAFRGTDGTAEALVEPSSGALMISGSLQSSWGPAGFVNLDPVAVALLMPVGRPGCRSYCAQVQDLSRATRKSLGCYIAVYVSPSAQQGSLLIKKLLSPVPPACAHTHIHRLTRTTAIPRFSLRQKQPAAVCQTDDSELGARPLCCLNTKGGHEFAGVGHVGQSIRIMDHEAGAVLRLVPAAECNLQKCTMHSAFGSPLLWMAKSHIGCQGLQLLRHGSQLSCQQDYRWSASLVCT